MLDTWPDYEEQLPPPVKRNLWIELLIAIGIAVSLAAILGPLMGCATAREPEVCYVKVMGQTEDGTLLEFHHCMSPDAFAETQK